MREQPGPSVKQQLVKSNPKPREVCGRELCPYAMAKTACKERCYRESVGYMGRCLRCAAKQREEGVKEEKIVWTVYHGESSRSVPSRSREHFSDYSAAMRKPAPVRVVNPGEEEVEGSSWMADHARSHHAGVISADVKDDYDFVLLDQFRKPLLRQLEEAVRIKQSKAGFIMLGRGPKAKKMLLNPAILNRKTENFSPWLLTLGGG